MLLGHKNGLMSHSVMKYNLCGYLFHWQKLIVSSTDKKVESKSLQSCKLPSQYKVRKQALS